MPLCLKRTPQALYLYFEARARSAAPADAPENALLALKLLDNRIVQASWRKSAGLNEQLV